MMGFGKRLSYAFRCFFSVLSNGEIPAEIAPELVPELTRPAPVFERARSLRRPRRSRQCQWTGPCRCWLCCSATGG